MSAAIRFYVYAFMVCASAFLVRPGLAADADNGSRLAHRWCEARHVIASIQSRSSTDAAPPFPSIAARPDFDAAKVALFLFDPHPKMPDMSLTRAEAADLAAYIASLRK